MVLGILVFTSENVVYRLQGDGDFFHVRGAECPKPYSSVTGRTNCENSANIFYNYSSEGSESS